ncbi:MAG: hypothetical protein LBT91_00270 [Bifidobacteriaceae bacterium]|jgi:hypothetical protein|nr:hypothetical protein [Bifidobacteriaceae bacterium]
MKFLKLKKLGLLGLIFVFIYSNFLYGFLNNSFAETSAAPLPITHGGTGSKTATQAAANLLGSNFANYEGILPVSKGGTGSNNKVRSVYNIEDRPELQILYPSWTSTQYWVKVLDIGVSWGEISDQVLKIVGLGGFGNQKEFFLTILHRTETVHITLTGYHTSCNPETLAGVWIIDSSDPNNKRIKVYLHRDGWGGHVKLENVAFTQLRYTTWYHLSRTGIEDFTPEFLTDKPETENEIYPYCVSYI